MMRRTSTEGLEGRREGKGKHPTSPTLNYRSIDLLGFFLPTTDPLDPDPQLEAESDGSLHQHHAPPNPRKSLPAQPPNPNLRVRIPPLLLNLNSSYPPISNSSTNPLCPITNRPPPSWLAPNRSLQLPLCQTNWRTIPLETRGYRPGMRLDEDSGGEIVSGG